MDFSLTLVTNAHEKLIRMKTEETGIDTFFGEIISSHSIGHVKEENAFWEKLKSKVPFDENKTLLIDDNLTVLRTAREFGIKHLLTVAKPNSQKPNQNSGEFEAVYSFDGIVF